MQLQNLDDAVLFDDVKTLEEAQIGFLINGQNTFQYI